MNYTISRSLPNELLALAVSAADTGNREAASEVCELANLHYEEGRITEAELREVLQLSRMVAVC